MLIVGFTDGAGRPKLPWVHAEAACHRKSSTLTVHALDQQSAAHLLAWNIGTIARYTDLLLRARQSGRLTAMACKKLER